MGYRFPGPGMADGLPEALAAGPDLVAGLTTSRRRDSEGDGVRHRRGIAASGRAVHGLHTDGHLCRAGHIARAQRQHDHDHRDPHRLGIESQWSRAVIPAALLQAAALLTLMVVVLLMLASALRLGFVANFISEPVLVGFKAGIAPRDHRRSDPEVARHSFHEGRIPA